MKMNSFQISTTFQPRLLATLIASLIVAPAWSEQTISNPDVTILPDVVVTATRDTTPLTIVTNPKTPRQPVPASDGADYLKTIPGFSTIRNGGSNADPVLRGMYGSRINILTNDAGMLGGCPGRMDNPLSYIVPETFDRLTVIKGPQTVQWGPGASAGTVRFERDTPRFDEPGVRISGGALAASWQRQDVNLDATAGNASGFARFTGSYASQNDYQDGQGNTVPSAWRKWATDAIVGLTPSKDTLLEISAGTGDGNARYAGRSMDGSQFLRESAGIKLEQNLDSIVSKILLQYNYNYADHVMDNYSLRKPDPRSSMPMPMASDVDRRTHSARIAATISLNDDVSVDTGLDYSANTHRYRSGMGRNTYQKQNWTNDASFKNTGIFAEAHWQTAANQLIISGLRVDFAEATDERLKTTGMMPKPNPTANQTRTDSLPSGFVRYEFSPLGQGTTYYAGLGHVERFPDYWELFSPKMGPAKSVNAFSGVQPEKTTQLDIGLTMKQQQLEGWLSAYAGRVNDFILFEYMSSGMMGSTSQARNIDANIAGFELGGKYEITRSWKVDGSLAYAWGEQTSDNQPLPQIPPLEARLGLRYESESWSAGGLWRVVSSQHRYTLNQGNVVGKDFGPSAGFGVVSLNGSYRLNKSFNLTAGIDNLFDKYYSEHLNLAGNSGFGYAANQSVPEPGRSVWIKLSGKY
jgi:iron complex outermembrane receptor protein